MANFPKIKPSIFTADKGVNAVSGVVNDEFKWIFRRVPSETDFGIDSYFEVVTDSGYVTGQYIAAQIKSGISFFKTETPSAYTFYGDKKHLNYYANIPHPVIIIIFNPKLKKGHWVQFKLETIEGTPSGWKVSIPKKNIFDANAKPHLLKLVGPYKDHTGDLEEQWALNEIISSGSYLHYIIHKTDIELGNVDGLSAFVKRICANQTIERAIQGKVLLSIDGYDNDPRELFEIPEICSWFLKYTKLNFPWFYLLETTFGGHWLKLDFVVHARGVRGTDPESGVIRVDVRPPKAAPWLKRNFLRLNAMTEKLAIPIEENRRITFAVFDLLQIPSQND